MANDIKMKYSLCRLKENITFNKNLTFMLHRGLLNFFKFSKPLGHHIFGIVFLIDNCPSNRYDDSQKEFGLHALSKIFDIILN